MTRAYRLKAAKTALLLIVAHPSLAGRPYHQTLESSKRPALWHALLIEECVDKVPNRFELVLPRPARTGNLRRLALTIARDRD